MALPPLNFLPTIEAAARLGSFRAAAAELHLTPSAVSQQIRAVETALGAELFARTGRTVALTAQGQAYCEEVRRALRDLSDAGRRVRSRATTRILRLATVDFLAHEFLIPRLTAFQKTFPSIELRIEASMKVVDLQSSELDAALRVRGRAGSGLTSIPIGPVVATPVCAPEIAKRLHAPRDLPRETLIEMRGAGTDIWVSYLKRHGSNEDVRVLTFEGYLETLTAAARGLGVAFGLFPMTSEWVLDGRIAVPFAMRMPIEGGVYLVHRANDPRAALLAEMAEWLREQYAAVPLLPEGRVVEARPRRRAPRPFRRQLKP